MGQPLGRNDDFSRHTGQRTARHHARKRRRDHCGRIQPDPKRHFPVIRSGRIRLHVHAGRSFGQFHVERGERTRTHHDHQLQTSPRHLYDAADRYGPGGSRYHTRHSVNAGSQPTSAAHRSAGECLFQLFTGGANPLFFIEFFR